jgi:hypothetical protein
MRDGNLPGIDVGNKEEFEAALAAVIEAGLAASVDVHGAWTVETDRTDNDWDVEIVRLVRDPEPSVEAEEDDE